VKKSVFEKEINFREWILNKEFWPFVERKKYIEGTSYRRALGEIVIVFETLNNLAKVSRRFGDL
jgi:hypothetical protein